MLTISKYPEEISCKWRKTKLIHLQSDPFFFPKDLSLISTTLSIPYYLFSWPFSRENVSWKFMENEVFNVSSESVTAIN